MAVTAAPQCRDVVADGLVAEDQPRGDLRIRETSCQEGQDLGLARGELRERRNDRGTVLPGEATIHTARDRGGEDRPAGRGEQQSTQFGLHRGTVVGEHR